MSRVAVVLLMMSRFADVIFHLDVKRGFPVTLLFHNKNVIILHAFTVLTRPDP